MINNILNSFSNIRLNIYEYSILINFLLLVIIIVILSLIYSNKVESNSNIKKRNIFKAFDVKSALTIVLAALGGTLLISLISSNVNTNIGVFFCILLMIPSVITSEYKRIRQENVFNDVIKYCSNTSMLLKQEYTPYDALLKVRHDLKTSLKTDVESLLTAMQEGKEQTSMVMKILENNYPYSCVRNLNIIINYLYFENPNLSNTNVITIYQDTLSKLVTAVRINKSKRSSLRIQYILISLICFGSYLFFIKQIGGQLNANYNDDIYVLLNNLFIFGMLISLFAVNRYFTANGTKE